MANEVAKTSGNNKLTFSAYMTGTGISNKVNQIIGDEKSGKRFISGIISAVSVNPTLSECDNASILSGALLGESLNLSPSPQLGHYYLVPFNDKTKGKVATFQLGWKGYYQLALRSGYYKKINVLPIKEGELVSWNPLEEEIKVNLIEDDDAREKAKTIGYYAMYEYLNGFKKAIYWSKAKMENHANQYSMGYRAKKGYTFWEKDFDSMAMKTMLRQLISKYGIMSTEMQNAFEGDMALINEDGSKSYVDNQEEDFEIKEQPKVFNLEDIE
jgi:recombination protein RecT